MFFNYRSLSKRESIIFAFLSFVFNYRPYSLEESRIKELERDNAAKQEDIEGKQRLIEDFEKTTPSKRKSSQWYGLKTLGGLSGLDHVFRNYPDPPNFVHSSGEVALKNFSINHWNRAVINVVSEFDPSLYSQTFPTSTETASSINEKSKKGLSGGAIVGIIISLLV